MFCQQATRLAILIAHFGSKARNGKKGRKMDFGPTGKKRKWPFLTHFCASSPIFRPCFPLFPGGAKIHFVGHFFPISGWGPYRAIRMPRLSQNPLYVSRNSFCKFQEASFASSATLVPTVHKSQQKMIPDIFGGSFVTYSWSFVVAVELLCLHSLEALIRRVFQLWTTEL